MKKIIQFSKSQEGLYSIKKDFYLNNLLNLKKSIQTNKFYNKQPLRTKCKNCNIKKSKKSFTSFNTNYFICKKCFHVNGNHEDNKKFINYLYKSNRGKKYAKNYLANYSSRLKYIYIPKIKFLKKVIGSKIDIMDIGAGAGHFLKACELNNIKAIGYEPNLTMIDVAKKKLKKNKIYPINLEKIYDQILNSNNKCISLIGVIEHLNNPRKIFSNFKNSKAKYLFFSLPLFSLSVLLENSTKDVFPRQLSSAHTHLYTKKSIMHVLNKNKLQIRAEWWFGTDFSDLFRTLIVKSKFFDIRQRDKMYKIFLYDYLDKLQNVLDKGKVCSEVHMVVSKK